MKKFVCKEIEKVKLKSLSDSLDDRIGFKKKKIEKSIIFIFDQINKRTLMKIS